MLADELTAPLSATLGVRPARGLVLVPNIVGISWMRTFEAAIASQMRCWGGGQNLVVPFDDKIGDNPLFWHLIDRLDPDQIRVYTGSMADLEELDPEEYRTAREAQQAEVADLPGNHEPFWDAWRRLQLVECDIPVGLRTEVNRRVAPLQLAGFEGWPWTNGATEPLEPFTDVTHFVNLPGRVTEVGRANLSEVERLLLTVEVGRLPPAMRENLVARGFDLVVQELAGSGPARMMIFRRQPSDDVYPLAVSETGLAWYRSARIRPFPVPIVVGDDPWDFALFYALRRWRSVAYWVPESLLEDEGFCRNVVSAVEFRQPFAAYGATVISASSEELATSACEQLKACRERVLARRRPRAELTSAGWADAILAPPNRLYELDSFDRPYALYLHKGRTGELPTPTPERVTTTEVHTLQWFTDVAVDGWGALRDPDLPSVLFAGRNLDPDRLRVGRETPSYLSPQAFTFAGMSPKSAALRPQLVPLPLTEQLRRIAARRDWRVTQSDKGVYASESAHLFGSPNELAIVLRDPPLRRVIDGFLAGDVANAPGRLLADRRRYLTYEDMCALAGADNADRVLGRFGEAAAVTRGLVLKCERCRAAGFYTPAESDPTFRCQSCRLEQRPTRASWLDATEPVWHYRLDEVLRRFVQHNGHLPLFAAMDLLAVPEDAGSIEFAFELEFRRRDEALECDIVARRASELWLGEATIRNYLAGRGESERQRLDLIHRVADELNARHVVLATSQTFRDATRKQALRRLRSPWYELHIVEEVSLGPAAV